MIINELCITLIWKAPTLQYMRLGYRSKTVTLTTDPASPFLGDRHTSDIRGSVPDRRNKASHTYFLVFQCIEKLHLSYTAVY